MHFEFISDRVDAIPIVTRWYFDEWGHSVPEASFEKTLATLRESLNRDKPPLVVLAVQGEIVVGAAELKPHEMLSVYPDKEPWLGGVFVRPDFRNRRIASQLAMKIVEIAESFGVDQLFLQTERLDGGLYARLGWRPIEQVNYRGCEVLVMERRLYPSNSSSDCR